MRILIHFLPAAHQCSPPSWYWRYIRGLGRSVDIRATLGPKSTYATAPVPTYHPQKQAIRASLLSIASLATGCKFQDPELTSYPGETGRTSTGNVRGTEGRILEGLVVVFFTIIVNTPDLTCRRWCCCTVLGKPRSKLLVRLHWRPAPLGGTRADTWRWMRAIIQLEVVTKVGYYRGEVLMAARTSLCHWFYMSRKAFKGTWWAFALFSLT